MSGAGAGWRLQVRHVTGYRYEGDATASYNEVRVTPARTARQLVLEDRVEVHPNARLARYEDYWGTAVHSFDLHRPHRELTVVSTCHVETSGARELRPELLIDWEELCEPETVDRWCEYLEPTRYTRADDAIRELAAEVAGAPSPAAAVWVAEEIVRELLAYERGATHVHTTAAEALAERRGVCQDFVHLALALLREAGVPCRYASGYLHPSPAAVVGEQVAGESHAWLEAWLGEWWPVDPTNGRPVGPGHVLVARGRDYADVPPLRGVYHGGRAEVLDVVVELTRRA